MRAGLGYDHAMFQPARPIDFVPVHAGDRVAVVCPAGTVEAEPLARGIAWLRQRYRLDDDPRRVARDGYLAGCDGDRCEALVEALEEPSIRAVFVGRGGYGSMRVLERAGDRIRQALHRDPKPLVGFSDITALHALWAQQNVLAVHGPMIAAIGRGSVRDADRDAIIALLERGQCAAWERLDVVIPGACSGRAAGGNLALLAGLAGTPFSAAFDGAVLFVEDVGERPYRVDRMLTQLRLAGALRNVRGIVLGEFIDCEPGPDRVCVEDVLRDRLGDLGVPVYAGGPFGHGARQAPIALGACVSLQEGCVRFETVERRAIQRGV